LAVQHAVNGEFRLESDNILDQVLKAPCAPLEICDQDAFFWKHAPCGITRV